MASLEMLKKISEVEWEIPKDYKEGMLVPARIYATKKILEDMDDQVFDQLTNVACLPGIQKYAYCMPDGHSGYGFPIGGVGAFDLDKGIISPGGVGFDVNCGVRLMRTNLTLDDVKPKIKLLIDTLFELVPAGVGSSGILRLNEDTLKEVTEKGVTWCLENDYATKEDLEHIEDNGQIKDADIRVVSQKARKRGLKQVGTLGSGNHYLEIQVVDEIFQPEIAEQFGIKENQILIMVHCGSRGFGHQIGTDYLKISLDAMKKYGIHVKDRELACAPFKSEEGQNYYKAMACAANLAFVNRQMITHKIREGLNKVFKKEVECNLIYDIAHNIAKIEKHKIDGKQKEVLVHRKGATRCFGPSRMTGKFSVTGQPVLVGGSMQTLSYLLVGTDKAEELTFSSTMHGSGRRMSRKQAKQEITYEELMKQMEEKGIYVRTASRGGFTEEAGLAYKNISDVIETMEKAGVSKKVVSLRPIGNIKG